MTNACLQVGERLIDLSSPAVMGILNVTPDSFSDGGQLHVGSGSGVFRVSVDKALRQAQEMAAAGASIIDVGGESTRPGAQQVGAQEELERVLPVIESLRREVDVAISIDSSTPAVIRQAVAAGAGLVNDVRALGRPGAVTAALEHNAAICLMHMRGEPATMQAEVDYEDILSEVLGFLRARVEHCEAAGIARARLLIDPGFGFAKTVEQNYRILQQLAAFKALKLPILIGVSRKSMLGAVTGRAVGQRLAAGIAATTVALMNGASIVRTHDVAATIDAIKIHGAVVAASNKTG